MSQETCPRCRNTIEVDERQYKGVCNICNLKYTILRCEEDDRSLYSTEIEWEDFE